MLRRRGQVQPPSPAFLSRARGFRQGAVHACESLEEALPKELDDYQGISHPDLETRLVAVHARQGQAEALRDEYRGALAWDEKQRDNIKADQRSRTQALLSGSD